MTDGSPADTLLLEGLLQNDPRAWQVFKRQYDGLIVRCIQKVTSRFPHRVSDEDVRDLHASFLLALLANDRRRLRAYDPTRGTQLGTWIGLLASNHAWDHVRTQVRRPHQSPAWLDEVTADDDAHEIASSRELCTRVGRVLARFPHRDRAFVTRYFVDGCSPEEIAREMGISVKTVYSKKHKIRARLVQILESKGIRAAAA